MSKQILNSLAELLGTSAYTDHNPCACRLSDPCDKCCKCDMCSAIRHSIIRQYASAMHIDSTKDADVVAELLEGIRSVMDSKGFVSRYGFDSSSMPDSDTVRGMTVDQLRVIHVAIASLPVVAEAFNDAATHLRGTGNSIVDAAARAILFDGHVAQNLMILMRDMWIMICRLALQNPGLLSFEDDMAMDSAFVNAGIAALQLQINMYNGDGILDSIPTGELESLVNDIVDEANSEQPSRINPLGGLMPKDGVQA